MHASLSAMACSLIRLSRTSPGESSLRVGADLPYRARTKPLKARPVPEYRVLSIHWRVWSIRGSRQSLLWDPLRNTAQETKPGDKHDHSHISHLCRFHTHHLDMGLCSIGPGRQTPFHRRPRAHLAARTQTRSNVYRYGPDSDVYCLYALA